MNNEDKRFYRAEKLVQIGVITCASRMISGLCELPYHYRTEEMRDAMDPDYADPDDRKNLIYGPRIDGGEFTEFSGYWIIDERLARKLSEHGEVVAELFGWHIWARVSGGQMIAVDNVIQDIAEELGIEV